jgi:hypothetical protein
MFVCKCVLPPGDNPTAVNKYIIIIINARIKRAKTGLGPPAHSTLVVICVFRLLFVLFYVLFVCKCVLPPGDNPIAVNKYIISYRITYLC